MQNIAFCITSHYTHVLSVITLQTALYLILNMQIRLPANLNSFVS